VRTALTIPTSAPAWLAAAADADRVTAALRDLLHPEPGEPPGCDVERLRCELLDLRARGATWRARYRVVEPLPGPPSALVLVGELAPGALLTAEAGRSAAGRVHAGAHATGQFGTESWRAWLPELGLTLRTETEDRRLSAAALLLDPTSARSLVERALRSRRFPGLRLGGCAIRSARYLYGSRCTVVLDLQVVDGSGPATVVAKAHAGGDGSAVDAAMRALWATALADGGVVRLAEPLGYLPDPGVLVQGVVPGERTAREVLAAAAAGGDASQAEAVLLKIAEGMAALHGCGVEEAPLQTWGDDVDRVRRIAARLAPTWPEPAKEVLAALELIDRAGASGTTATGPRPSHGSFRPSQVLVDGDRVAFVDFDGFCLAEPERDLGRFCKGLRKLILAPAAAASEGDRAGAVARAERLVQAFLSHYVRSAAVSFERVAAWEALYEVTGQAHRAATLRQPALGFEAARPAS